MKNVKSGLKRIVRLGSNFASYSLGLRLLAWFTVSLAISLIFFQEFWASLWTMLSPDWIFGQYHASPWGVLGLCGIWLWLKRKSIRKAMGTRQNLAFISLGLGLVAGAVLMPTSQDYLVFQVLLASLGVFLAIYALMMLDTPLPPRKAAYLFLFGTVGTWLQSLIRLIALMFVAYYLGEDAMWTTHFLTIYILFPLWYLLFVYIYFRQARPLRRKSSEVSTYEVLESGRHNSICRIEPALGSE